MLYSIIDSENAFSYIWTVIKTNSHPTPPFIFRQFEKQQVPTIIFGIHIFVACLALLLTLVVTGGYVAACENIRTPERLAH